MTLETCPHCGRFASIASSRVACQNCYEWEEACYELIHRFMEERKAATVTEVSTALKLDEDLVLLFVRAGKLQSTEYNNLMRLCKNCEAPIATGTLCNPCLSKMRADLVRPMGSTGKANTSPLQRTPTTKLSASPIRNPVDHELLTDRWSRKEHRGDR